MFLNESRKRTALCSTHKNPLNYFCLDPSCPRRRLICQRCILDHQSHSHRTFTVQQLQEKKMNLIQASEQENSKSILLSLEMFQLKMKQKISKLRHQLLDYFNLSSQLSTDIFSLLKKPLTVLSQSQTNSLAILLTQSSADQFLNRRWRQVEEQLMKSVKDIPSRFLIRQETDQFKVFQISEVLERKKKNLQVRLDVKSRPKRTLGGKQNLNPASQTIIKNYKSLVLQNQVIYETIQEHLHLAQQQQRDTPLSQLIISSCPQKDFQTTCHHLHDINTLTIFDCCSKRYWCSACHDGTQDHKALQKAPSRRYCVYCKQEFEVQMPASVPIKCSECQGKKLKL